MVYLLLFVFGTCIGSFLSCLVYRLNNSNPSTSSVCDHCGKQLAWHDNIPLFSFLWLRGKSRCCRSPIPFQYFLTEMATGILTVFISYNNYNFYSIYNLLIVYLFIAIFLADLNYGIIPDEFAFMGMAIAMAYHLSPAIFLNYLFSGILAGLLFLFLHLITKRKGMGMGDAKLAVLMGLFLGFPKIVVAFYFAFLTGAGLAVILILLGKKKLKSTIPFGPFLVAGTIFALFWGEEMIKGFSSFW